MIELNSKIVELFLTTDQLQVLFALTLGQQLPVSFSLRQDFITTGMFHILVVSGFHFVFVVEMVTMVIKKHHRLTVACISLLTIFGYAWLVGGLVSVIRSAIAITVKVLARVFHRQYSSVIGLIISGLIVISYINFELSNLSFLLSFGASLALVVGSSVFKPSTWIVDGKDAAPIQHMSHTIFTVLGSFFSYLFDSVSTSVIVLIFIGPVLGSVFGVIALAGTPGMILLGWMLSPLLLVSFLVVITLGIQSWWGFSAVSVVFTLLVSLYKLGYDYMSFIVKALTQVSWLEFKIVFTPELLWWYYSGLGLFLLLAVFLKRIRIRFKYLQKRKLLASYV